MGLNSIANIIAPLAKKTLGKKGFVETDIITNWDKIVGTEIAEASLPQKIDFPREEKSSGILHIATISGAFALEIQHREKTIIEKINSYFGYNAIARLKITQNAAVFTTFADTHQEVKKSLASKEEETYIKEITGNLKHQELKEVLIRLGCNIAGENHKKG